MKSKRYFFYNVFLVFYILTEFLRDIDRKSVNIDRIIAYIMSEVDTRMI